MGYCSATTGTGSYPRREHPATLNRAGKQGGQGGRDEDRQIAALSSVSCQSSSPWMLLSSRALVDSLGCRGSVGGHSGACQRIRSFGDGPVWQLAVRDLRAGSAGAGETAQFSQRALVPTVRDRGPRGSRGAAGPVQRCAARVIAAAQTNHGQPRQMSDCNLK